ncbi:hypothetical protein RHGRI_000806 [Rhododendron griersonianum]|uniref:Uncharacterized protein n=1 Tax=Rhododendron griersonianum TaxID=479676 RepID=A0AAV6LL40_9ERIC|nr:hypothetical protein RHGRI_000806 [Rhododendron griersonianum]
MSGFSGRFSRVSGQKSENTLHLWEARGQNKDLSPRSEDSSSVETFDVDIMLELHLVLVGEYTEFFICFFICLLVSGCILE